MDERKLITAWANFRLGTYIHEAPKDEDEERKCVLCGGIEDSHHWFRDCEAVADLRLQLPRIMTTQEISKEQLEKTANFLHQIFKRRKEYLKL